MNFFEKYFIYPTENLLGYNPVNTTVYALVFIIAAYILYKYIEKSKISINRDFIISTLPYAFLGIFMRLQVDYGRIDPTLLTVTPGVWIKAFLAYFIIYLISKTLVKEHKSINILNRTININNYHITFLLGFFIVVLYILQNPPVITNYEFLYIYLAFLGIVILLVIKNNVYALAILGQLMDALGSYIGVIRGFNEIHVVANFIISNLGPAYFPLIKITITILFVYYIKRLDINDNLKKYALLIIFILGFGPGTRNWFLLMYK